MRFILTICALVLLAFSVEAGPFGFFNRGGCGCSSGGCGGGNSGQMMQFGGGCSNGSCGGGQMMMQPFFSNGGCSNGSCGGNSYQPQVIQFSNGNCSNGSCRPSQPKTIISAPIVVAHPPQFPERLPQFTLEAKKLPQFVAVR